MVISQWCSHEAREPWSLSVCSCPARVTFSTDGRVRVEEFQKRANSFFSQHPIVFVVNAFTWPLEDFFFLCLLFSSLQESIWQCFVEYSTRLRPAKVELSEPWSIFWLPLCCGNKLLHLHYFANLMMARLLLSLLPGGVERCEVDIEESRLICLGQINHLIAII